MWSGGEVRRCACDTDDGLTMLALGSLAVEVAQNELSDAGSRKVMVDLPC